MLNNLIYKYDIHASYVGDDEPTHDELTSFVDRKISIVFIGICCDSELHVHALETYMFSDLEELEDCIRNVRNGSMFCCYEVEAHWRFVDDNE